MKLKQQKINLSVNTMLAGGFIFFFNLFISLNIYAGETVVSPGQGKLQFAIDNAVSGDSLMLSSGIYYGAVTINKTLAIIGTKSSVIDGEGSGHVIHISAPDVIIKGITIQHSGNDLDKEHSAVFITAKGDRTSVENNFLKNNLIGIYLKGPESALIINNKIIGSQHHRVNDRGNGIYLWNTPGSIIRNNDIRYGRDGIFVTTSSNNTFDGNRLRDLRFAVHYMYTNNSEVSNNTSINNDVGYALMFSHHILAKNNRSIGDNKRGLFFNFTNYSVIEHNEVSGGVEKCVFIYNANYNQINNNKFSGCHIGIHFTAGSDHNDIYRNDFMNNRTQVKYVGSRHLEWSKDGLGNYWSDNAAFDLNNDGIADQVYRPNDLVDQIVWRHPMAKLLLNSPSVQLLKWAQSEFPSLHPGGVIDSVPRMRPATE